MFQSMDSQYAMLTTLEINTPMTTTIPAMAIINFLGIGTIIKPQANHKDNEGNQ